MGIQNRLNKAFENVPVLPLTAQSKYILISDCHRGTGTSSDNFLKINTCILPHFNIIISGITLILKSETETNYGKTAHLLKLKKYTTTPSGRYPVFTLTNAYICFTGITIWIKSILSFVKHILRHILARLVR